MQPTGLSPITAAANLRRSVVVACAVALVAIAVASVAGHPMMGVYGTLGLALGALNNWLLQRSVVAYGNTVDIGKKKFRRGVMGRLSAFTVFALVLAWFEWPDGAGSLVGLAAFQILMLVGAAVPVFRSMRPTS